MKELSIEQKAAAYDEAIKRARKLQENSNGMILKKWLWNIFPELKEGEDERIRKIIRGWIYTRPASFFDDGISKEEILAWLEKQGEQKSIDNLTQQEAMDVAVAKGFDKQKPADKVEPKFNFKVGQWIVATGKCVYLIAKIDGFNVTLIDTNGDEYVFDTNSLEDAHEWTIEDAKAGDVLRIRNLTFIFQEITNNNVCHKDAVVAYCSYEDNDDGFGVCGPDCITDLEIITPATKEQRDLLFQKMKEAGYEWDANKKQLKKIIEEVNGEDYGIDSLWHAQRILEKTLGSVDGYQSDDGILEHKCAISAVKKLYEQKPAWSEEDENIRQWIISDIEKLFVLNKKSSFIVNKEIDWLESLRLQKQWKPSKEQMEALWNVYEGGEKQSALASLYNDLKKL